MQQSNLSKIASLLYKSDNCKCIEKYSPWEVVNVNLLGGNVVKDMQNNYMVYRWVYLPSVTWFTGQPMELQNGLSETRVNIVPIYCGTWSSSPITGTQKSKRIRCTEEERKYQVDLQLLLHSRLHHSSTMPPAVDSRQHSLKISGWFTVTAF